MISSKHAALKAYLITGELPTDLTSTPSNFRREASHYEIGSDGILKRGGKTVALYKDRKIYSMVTTLRIQVAIQFVLTIRF